MPPANSARNERGVLRNASWALALLVPLAAAAELSNDGLIGPGLQWVLVGSLAARRPRGDAANSVRDRRLRLPAQPLHPALLRFVGLRRHCGVDPAQPARALGCGTGEGRACDEAPIHKKNTLRSQGADSAQDADRISRARSF
jgi:hypothetical protein